MPTATRTRPSPHSHRTTRRPVDLAGIAMRINQLAAQWRALIGARVLGAGPDRSWSAAMASVEAQLDALFAQKRRLLAGTPRTLY